MATAAEVRASITQTANNQGTTFPKACMTLLISKEVSEEYKELVKKCHSDYMYYDSIIRNEQRRGVRGFI